MIVWKISFAGLFLLVMGVNLLKVNVSIFTLRFAGHNYEAVNCQYINKQQYAHTRAFCQAQKSARVTVTIREWDHSNIVTKSMRL